ncbi:MAG: prepilin-type N-terminal cleavage/methylation domain-containing protein [Capsulimonadaceae bacterium]|nr:prepilin-type N-terminal cleavage/methylation domain-containing protein [Capsulimonadaceae bacterium]
MQQCSTTISRRTRRNQGFSLVEVLVAIAVLIVGIVAVIELFPPGFFALNAADTRGRAQAMATDQIQRTTAALTQISLIYSETSPMDDNSPTLWSQGWGAGQTAGGSANNEYQNGGPNSELVVSGEMAAIPKLNTSNTQQSTSVYAWLAGGTAGSHTLIQTPLGAGTCTYALTFAPIQLATPGAMTLRGANWTGYQAASYTITSGLVDVPPVGVYDPSDVLKAGQPQFEVDYTNGKLALPLEYGYYDYNSQVRQGVSTPALLTCEQGSTANKGYTQTFAISVTSSSGTSTGILTVDPSDIYYNYYLATSVAGGDPTYHSLWFDPTSPGPNSSVKWAGGNAPSAPWISVTLRRDFQLTETAQGAPKFDGDPYEYALDANIASTSSVYSGLIHLNPWAATLRDSRNNPVNLVADYVVADTHILCEDHAATGDSIRVDAPSILQIGDPLDQGDATKTSPTYQGLIDPRLSMGGPVAVDVIVYDLDTGAALSSGGDFQTNYSAGRIQLGDNFARSNAHLRVVYRARHLWSFNMTKAAASYAYAGVYSSSNPANHSVATNLGNYWLASSSASNTRLYFPYTDVGKTISIGTLLITTTVTTARPSGQRSTPGGNWLVLAPDSTMTSAGIKMGYVDLLEGRNSDGNPEGLINTGNGDIGLYNGTNGPSSNITGGSFTARITYMENNSWRHQDVTSYVNPATQ